MGLPTYIGFVQFDVIQGDWKTNAAKVKKGIAKLAPPQGSLIILPELWGSGFDYEHLSEYTIVTKKLLSFLQEEATHYGICIAGSLPEAVRKEDTLTHHNTLYFTGAEGVYGKYRKQHLFEPMGENNYFSPGDTPQPVLLKSGLAAGLVCFDLRFPDLVTIQAGMGANIVVVSAQWPTSRLSHWRTLLRARAIENQIYVIACNRCGKTDSLDFAGHSMIIGPDGEIIKEAGTEESIMGTFIDAKKQKEVRSIFNTVSPRPYRIHDKNKCKDLNSLSHEISLYKKLGYRVVFTNGCFDILHQGHVSYLEQARKQGDFLVVGLNSDHSIRSIKGPNRPINSEKSRARILASLGCVDRIVIFEEDTPLHLITTLMPDVLVKGADWPVNKIVGGAEVIANGGQVTNIPMVESFSTTRTIEQIKNG